MAPTYGTEKPQYVWRNTLTLAGAWIAGSALLFIFSLLFIDVVTPRPSPYIGLFTFLVFPFFILFGAVLIVIGLLSKRRRLRRKYGALSTLSYYPRVDFNLPSHRRGLATAVAIGVFTVLFVGAFSYRGYHYTDSNQFCGAVCHTVMDPQYTAHNHSPHARVDCAECHIGKGASWYVKSKLAGVRQVLAVVTDSYPRPIPPAIIELRPAKETCEQCHWPEKFYGDQLVTKQRFANDESSTPRTVRMLVRTGGSDPTAGPTTGIHWHMALSRQIEFVATDEALQTVPWVRVIDDRTGATRIFRSDGKTSADPPPPGVRRAMDCMDCHNRATHVFRSPADAADNALHARPELRQVPFAKRQLTAAVMQSFGSREEGLREAAETLKAYYKEHYPNLDSSQQAAVDELATAARQIYQINFFPYMHADWRTYPNNIGHFESAGCFRCHDGRHKDDTGSEIVSACNTCHEFLVPPETGSESLVRSDEFVHPVELPGVHAELRCMSCHSGGVLPEPTCEGCHADVAAFRAGTTPELKKFGIAAEPMNELVGCQDCHDVSEHLKLDTVNTACLNCHEADQYAGILARWKSEIAKKRSAVTASDAQTREVLERLSRTGALHNVDAARKILDALAAPGAA